MGLVSCFADQAALTVLAPSPTALPSPSPLTAWKGPECQLSLRKCVCQVCLLPSGPSSLATLSVPRQRRQNLSRLPTNPIHFHLFVLCGSGGVNRTGAGIWKPFVGKGTCGGLGRNGDNGDLEKREDQDPPVPFIDSRFERSRRVTSPSASQVS